MRLPHRSPSRPRRTPLQRIRRFPLVLERLEDRSLLSVNTTTHVPGPNVNASNLGGYQGETAIAINPTNAQNIIADSNNLGTGSGSGLTEAYISQDAGNTWTKFNLGGDGDPGIAFDANGVAYASFLTTSLGVGVRTSTNGGVSWNSQVTVSGGSQDKPSVTTGVNALNTSQQIAYVGWDDFGAGDVAKVASSTNGGATWSTPVAIDGKANEFDTQLSVGPQGQLYATWQNFGTSGSSTIMFSVSTNDGVTWSTPTVAASSTINVFLPSRYTIPAQNSRGIHPDQGIATEQTGANAGRIYLTYTNTGTGGHNDTNVYLIASDNGGSTWTALGASPVQVNTDTTTNSQFFQALAIDPTNGTVNLAWYDARNGATNKKVDIFFQSFTSAGVASGSNVKVTTKMSSETGSHGDANQFGDYMGIAASGGLAYPVWTSHTTNVTGSEEIMVDPPPPSPGAAAAPVSLSAPARTGAVPATAFSGQLTFVAPAGAGQPVVLTAPVSLAPVALPPLSSTPAPQATANFGAPAVALPRQAGDNAGGPVGTNAAAPVENRPVGDQSPAHPGRQTVPAPALPPLGPADVPVEAGTGQLAGDAVLAGQPRAAIPAEPVSPTLTGSLEDHDIALSFSLLAGLLLSWNGFDGGQEENPGSQARRRLPR